MLKSDVIRMYAVGDILVADGYHTVGYGVGSQIQQKGVYYPFRDVENILQQGDIVIGNLECAISNNSSKKGLRGKEFIGVPEVVRGLKRAGFIALSVANNHVLQHGRRVFVDTITNLANEGIIPIGRIPEGNVSQNLVCIKSKGVNIGLISYSLVEDAHNVNVVEYGFYYNEEEKIFKEVQTYRDNCDFLILMLHWGIEYVPVPLQKQIDLAHKLIDEGVDLIIGHHPHVLQGTESYRGKTIAYSLGNFVFKNPYQRCQQTAILSLNLFPDGKQQADLIPIWISENGVPRVPDEIEERKIQITIEENKELLAKMPLHPTEYNQLERKLRSEYRKKVKKMFLKNLFNIPPFYVMQMLLEFLIRRAKYYLKIME